LLAGLATVHCFGRKSEPGIAVNFKIGTGVASGIDIGWHSGGRAILLMPTMPRVQAKSEISTS
jgi:hypothetical protein